MSERQRRPAAFKLADPDVVVVASPEDTRRAAITVTPEPPAELPAVPMPEPRVRKFPWATMFWTACSGLMLLWLGHATVGLIGELFGRAEWLGGMGVGLAGAAVVALLGIIVREAVGLMRLGKIEGLRERALDIIASDDRTDGRLLAREMLTLTKRMPQLAHGRARLESHLDDIIDGADLVRLSERELMPRLDAEARKLVTRAATRVSVVTAVSPRAVVDMLFVLATALGLMRRLALLYGGRPGTLGLITLIRHAVSHLAFTGGLAATDSVIQQVIGHGVAAKLSAKLGEGVLNGLLTARLGLAAIEVARPLPFSALKKPTLNELAGSLLTLPGGEGGALARPPVRQD